MEMVIPRCSGGKYQGRVGRLKKACMGVAARTTVLQR
jgi:hypothetical protein